MPLSDEQLRDAYIDSYEAATFTEDADHSHAEIAGLRAVEAAVRADQIEQMVTAARDIAQSQYNKGYAESAFGANLVREHFVAIRAQLAVPEPAEVEWEYGYNTGSTVTFVGDRAQIEEWTLVRGMAVGVGDWGSRIVRRRKTGPWVPVTPGGTK